MIERIVSSTVPKFATARRSGSLIHTLTMLTNEEVAQILINQFGETVTDFDDPYNLLTCSTSRNQIIPLIKYLQEHPTPLRLHESGAHHGKEGRGQTSAPSGGLIGVPGPLRAASICSPPCRPRPAGGARRPAGRALRRQPPRDLGSPRPFLRGRPAGERRGPPSGRCA